MATGRMGRTCWEVSPTERRPPAGQRGPAAEEEAASPPVLSLSHFCRSPFLCFGDVRLGASRTLPLVLHNPNVEVAEVEISHFPAADLGFSVSQRCFVLQPKEKIVISVNWTPLKEGRVREIVTFLVNEVLKHQAILLGNAEELKKKKRSLWNTINKKKNSASSSHNKKISNGQNVNKTFCVSQKVDRIRSPLQACENLAMNEGCSPTENSSLTLEENKIPISPISPAFQECHGEICLPLSVRRSTTYSSLLGCGNEEQLKVEGATISKDFNFNEEVITETSFQSEENSKLILTPNCSSTLNIIQSQGNFLSPDSFVNNSHATNNEIGLVTFLSSDRLTKDNSESVNLESKTVHEIYRTILSPDSFINDNYGINQNLESDSVNPILSPNQFVKDNMAHIYTSQQTCEVSSLPNKNSQNAQSPQHWRKNEVLPCSPECQGSKTPKLNFEELKPVEVKSNYYNFTKQIHPKFSAVQDASSYNLNKQHKRRPILSTTVTKRKPTIAREKQTEINKPKAKRSLNSTVGDCEKVIDHPKEKEALHSHLPIIDSVLSKPKCYKSEITTSTTALVACKRKIDGNMEDTNVKVAITEHVNVHKIKRIHFSPLESKTSTVKKIKKMTTPISKHTSNREKLSLKKKPDSLAFKTPFSKTNKRIKPIVAVAQSNLTFIKPLKADIPRHPMPFAAKNMFYDERWKEKQEQGFTWWLNFILTPDDFTVKTSISEVNAATLLLGVENQHKISVPRAPTKDEMSLRAYTARCRLNRLRRTACSLFTSEKMVKAIKKLEVEIEARRLIVRKDRHLWKDIGERQKVLNWLLSYNPLWLRIGLEASKEILLAFSRDFLSGEGDLSRHLGLLGLPVSHVQTPFDEFDFSVTNLAVDLQCGVRLVRTMELLTQNWNLSKKLRIPAISRLQKIHNVDIVLEILKSRGIQLSDEHENMSELHKELLENEKKNFQLIRSAVRDLGGIPAMIHHSDMSNTIPDEKVVITYLSFLCARLLDLRKEIRAARLIQTTWRKYKIKTKLKLHQGYWRRYSTRKRFLKLKYYSVILQSRIRMIIAVKSYKRYLWATVTIQKHWRACLRRKQDQERYKRLKSSSLIIQSVFRRWRQRKMQLQIRAAVILQRAFRKWHSRKKTKEKSAIVIQSWYRRHKELRKYLHIRSCIVIIQRRFRCFQAQKLYKRKKESILTIQKHYKAYLKGKTERTNYLQKRAAAIQLQAAFRRMKARNLYRQMRAVCVLQSYWRMRQDKIRFLNFKKIVIKLQAHVRKHQQLQKYKRMKKAAIIIQTHFRAYVSARKVLATYQRTRSAVIVLQSAYRGMQARKTFVRIFTSIIKIQSYYRAYISRKKFVSLKNTTIKLQSVVKMKQARKKYLLLREAALLIQQWYRAQKMATRKREEYVQMRESCIKLQAFVRGYLVRKQMRLQRKAAVSLQSYFRMRRMRQHYLKTYKAVVVIQNYYRAYKAQVNQRKNFLQVKRAATCLQAVYRGYKVRQILKQQSLAALKIQTAFRSYSKRVKYQSVLWSVKKIQRWYRAYKSVYNIRTHFLKKRAAVISLQSAYRGWKVRQQIRRERQAAIKIQSTFRMNKAQKQFRLLKSAALVIQQHLRAWTRGKKQRMEYVELRHAVLVLQSAWKGRTLRRQIQRKHKCAAIIQSYYRMHVQQKRWRLMKKAALLIQMYYRAYSIGRAQHHLYLKTKMAVVVLQSAYRGMKVRKRIKKCSKAAVIIQSKYRAYRAQKKYAIYRASAIIIQRWYRDIKITSHQQKEYLNLKKTAIKIQAVYRGIRVRRHIQHMHMAATFIKAMFKMYLLRVRYHAMRRAAVVIQIRYRAYCQGKIQREKYLTILKAVNTLQASFRGARVRQTLRKMQVAATLIQSYYRRYRVQMYFNKLKKATKIVQQRYRAVKARDKQFQRYNKLRHSAIFLQATFRGMKTRRHLKVMHLAAALIQRRFRTLMMRRKFLSLRKTIIWIQRTYRAKLHAKHHLQFLQLQKAVIRIQSSYRGWMVRKQMQEMHRAAVLIQATFRMHRTFISFQTKKRASIIIQHHYRTYRAAKLQRENFIKQWDSAVIIQAAYKGMKARQLLREKHRAAIRIQSTYKMYKQYYFYQKLQWATKVLQDKYRANKKKQKALQSSMCKEETNSIQASFQDLNIKKQIQKQHEAAIIIQKHFKAFKTRRHYLHFRATVISVQRRYRALAATGTQAGSCIQSSSRDFKSQEGEHHSRSWATVMIQKDLCDKVTRKLEMQKCAALQIQSFLQMVVYRRRFVQQKRAAITLQRYFRTWQTRKQFLLCRKAVVVLQNHYRARLSAQHQKQVYLQIRKSVVIIQARIKGFIQKRKFHKIKSSTIKIQILEQRAKARLLHFTAAAYYHLSALRIQRAYKLHMARKNANKQVNSAICIQRWFRAKLQRKRFIEKYCSIIKTEHEVQEYMNQRNRAASVIQKAVRHFLLRKRQEKFNSRITKIQALWRGYSWRKKHDCTKIKAIRLSLQIVNREIREENKLYKRTTLALHYLLTYKHLSAILEALKHLEVVTRLSPRCCENMAESGAISKIFVLIRSCNRSVPCMEVIRYAVQVLLNVAKYEKTTSAVYDAENCIDTLLELLQMYREKPGDKVADKGGSIFTKTCCLLAVLLKTTNRASDVRSRSKVVDRIYSLYKLTARKHKINAERILNNQKKNSSIGIPFIPETPIRTRIVSRLKPDWVLRRDSIEEITNSLQAIQMVMDTLGIPY
ncbi:Abnormal spindle-like microcephaly-associated protein-like protein [Sciurus carolinensis]|uniref:Abnormal spindle-like microcephaly-associated protein-like protein n=1 Tax=Sciurus carolinensis TaxID=30640 RepID=A0AA41MPR2_SCICA|nr:Abnormal spindle-like microcephaly-associated protein-like protein [Sciurus carolinensis]